jgi:hypothetical protein
MREVQRRDGSVALYDEDDDQDMIVVEPAVIAFTPIHGNARCACGAALAPWSYRCVAADDVEIGCGRCHRVFGHFRLGTRVHR